MAKTTDDSLLGTEAPDHLLVDVPGGMAIAAERRPASDIIFNVADLDCSFKGNRILLVHPGRDTLNVEVEPITGAITTGVLKIKTALSQGAKDGVAPTGAINITSTAGTQKQSDLPVAGQVCSWVEVDTPDANLLARVRLTAMKS